MQLPMLKQIIYWGKDCVDWEKATLILIEELTKAGYIEKVHKIYAEIIETVSTKKDFEIKKYRLLTGELLAQSEYFAKTTEILSLFCLQGDEYAKGLHGFLYVITGWKNAFDKIDPEFPLTVTKEMVRIAAWVSPSWRKVYEEILDATENQPNLM